MMSRNTEPTEYHVSIDGSDSNDGSSRAPLRNISAAARLAQPGDVITVREGTYRECVNPPCGGESDDKRIVYRASQGETVEIKGSEIVGNWKNVEGPVWKATLPNSFFGEYNPYDDLIRGDWFDDQGRDHHTGQVYLNETPLTEASSLDGVMNARGNHQTWYAKVDEDTTTIWARFERVDPNRETVEMNVRPAVFYPDKPGVNYITVRGFTMRHAATQWAPPTTEQIGLIGTHWSKGWIIEDNIISDSRCTGITLGKYGESIDETGATADRYNQTILDALETGWKKGTVGHHVIRNNTIYNCEQAGIVGSMGAAFSEITGNNIHHIHVERKFGGAEMAGIKFHAPIDSIIKNNRIHHASLGIWMDWMTQGTRITGNLLYENSRDLFVEVNHGPFLVDNNIFLSEDTLLTWSEGGAYVHNLIAGDVDQMPELNRSTPFHKAHSTEVAGLSNIRGGDDRFYNNLFVGGNGLSSYDEEYIDQLRRRAAEKGLPDQWAQSQLERWRELDEPKKFPVWMDGNVFFGNAKPSRHEETPVKTLESPNIELVEEQEQVYLHINVHEAWNTGKPNKLVTTELLGKVKIANLPFINPDDTPLSIDADYCGNKRDTKNPFPGPFAQLESGKHEVKIWPR